MVDQAVGTPWDDPGWQAEALGWVDDQLVKLGLRRSSSPVVPRLRPWSVTVQVPTVDGSPVWFKATTSEGAFEARLLDALAELVPARVVAPLAVDGARGWTLTPHVVARPLRAVLDADRSLRHWEEPLRAYASMQRGLSAAVPELLALGVPDLRPLALPGLYARLGGAGGELASWCAELAASPVPPSIDHGDLHDGHLLEDGRVFDWGDASVAHPFASLLVTLRVVSERHAEPFGSPALQRLRDVYLEPWTSEYDRADLHRWVTLALRLGAIGRTLSWQRIFPGIGPEVRHSHAAQVAAWLRRFLADPPL